MQGSPAKDGGGLFLVIYLILAIGIEALSKILMPILVILVVGIAIFALTSAISILEAIVSSFIDEFHISRRRAVVIEGAIALIVGIIICMGYNVLYFEVSLPNGVTAQILDIMDYVSNNILMPIVSISTCILIGWILKTKTVIDETTKNGEVFNRKNLYIFMVKFAAPLLLIILFLKSLGILNF